MASFRIEFGDSEEYHEATGMSFYVIGNVFVRDEGIEVVLDDVRVVAHQIHIVGYFEIFLFVCYVLYDK